MLKNEHRGRLTKDGIRIYETADFAGMHVAGALAAQILDDIAEHVTVGQTTEELDRLITKMVEDAGATSATIGYKGYQHASCISVNHVVCHGIPGPKTLKDGDILNIDVTVIKDGFHGDTSRMFLVGKPSVQARRLVDLTYQAMHRAICAVHPGRRLGDLGHAIQSFAEEHRLSVVRDYCGHGIGREFHEEPQVLHYGKPGTGLPIQPGMTFTIEPMINAGRPQVKTLPDDWTVVTCDHSLSAQWEHTVLVTEDGFEVLTARPDEQFP